LIFSNRSQTFIECSQSYLSWGVDCPLAPIDRRPEDKHEETNFKDGARRRVYIQPYKRHLCSRIRAKPHSHRNFAVYQLSVFATAPAGLSAPDSITVLGDQVFIGYGDGHKPDGSDGLNSQVVQYNIKGHLVHIYTMSLYRRRRRFARRHYRSEHRIPHSDCHRSWESGRPRIRRHFERSAHSGTRSLRSAVPGRGLELRNPNPKLAGGFLL
jgi:hypothetical protein